MDIGDKDSYELAKAVQSHYDLVTFLNALALDAAEHPDGWAHTSVSEYLNSVAWNAPMIDGREGKVDEPTPERPTWQLIAELFLVGKYME